MVFFMSPPPQPSPVQKGEGVIRLTHEDTGTALSLAMIALSTQDSDEPKKGLLWTAVLATKLIHLPDKPAGVAKIGTHAVELPGFADKLAQPF